MALNPNYYNEETEEFVPNSNKRMYMSGYTNGSKETNDYLLSLIMVSQATNKVLYEIFDDIIGENVLFKTGTPDAIKKILQRQENLMREKGVIIEEDED